MIADPRIVTALARAVDAKAAKLAAASVPEGSVSHVEFSARIEGTVQRGGATTVTPTCTLLNKAVIAELLRRLGVTRDAALNTLREIATERIVDGRLDLSRGLADANPQLLVAVKQLEDDLVARLPKLPRAGSIRAALSVDLVDPRVT